MSVVWTAAVVHGDEGVGATPGVRGSSLRGGDGDSAAGHSLAALPWQGGRTTGDIMAVKITCRGDLCAIGDTRNIENIEYRYMDCHLQVTDTYHRIILPLLTAVCTF